ncbi:MAG: AMP-binding protein [Planctomycetes bacterium]|nr:AMP-binding protein [Planctomycetota bacterium]
MARGPTITPGYFKAPEETARVFKHGWFHTGDLAMIDAEGYLTIVDRLKDVINTGGEQVFSTEVENALFAHPRVEEAAVFAVPDPVWGEAVKAAVVLKPGEILSKEDLIAHCRGRLSAFKVPRSIDFMDTLPRTGSGKISKKTLRAPYWNDQNRQVH